MSWVEPSQPGSYLPPFVRHAHLRKAGAHLLMGMDCIQPSCRTAAARQGGLSPARPKELLILAACCRDACCIAKASRGIRRVQHRRIDIWAGDRWIEGLGLSYPLIHSKQLCRQRLWHRTFRQTNLTRKCSALAPLTGLSGLAPFPATCDRASSAAMRWYFRCPRTRGKYGHIRAAVHCVRLLANRTVHIARTRWTSLQSRCCIHPSPKRFFQAPKMRWVMGKCLRLFGF